jgi:hypothetical protein
LEYDSKEYFKRFEYKDIVILTRKEVKVAIANYLTEQNILSKRDDSKCNQVKTDYSPSKYLKNNADLGSVKAYFLHYSRKHSGSVVRS